jgi:YgiT-type zinc finger domain-containing protein
MKRRSIRSCPGEYEQKRIVHVVKHEGEVIVFDNVLAEVCSACGDTLLPLSTVEALERMLKNPGKTLRTAPVYKMEEVARA